MTVTQVIALLRQRAAELERVDMGREAAVAAELRRLAAELFDRLACGTRDGDPDPALGHLTRVAVATEAWRVEADEREARAANPEVVGMIERLTEEAVVRTLRRCADDVEGS